MSLDAPTPVPDWGMAFGRRLQEYLNSTRRAIDATLATLRTDVDNIGMWADWTPSVSGLTFSAESARYRQDGKTITVEYRGTISGVDGAGTFITFTLPVAMANVVVGDILSWGEAVYQDVNTVWVGKPRVDSTTVMSIRPQAGDGLGTGAWRSDGTQPVVVFSSGDILSFSMTYEGV